MSKSITFRELADLTDKSDENMEHINPIYDFFNDIDCQLEPYEYNDKLWQKQKRLKAYHFSTVYEPYKGACNGGINLYFDEEPVGYVLDNVSLTLFDKKYIGILRNYVLSFLKEDIAEYAVKTVEIDEIFTELPGYRIHFTSSLLPSHTQCFYQGGLYTIVHVDKTDPICDEITINCNGNKRVVKLEEVLFPWGS